MKKVKPDPFAASVPDPKSFRAPLDFIAAEHERQLLACEWLKQHAEDIAEGRGAPSAGAILGFLTKDLPLHTADEEKSLFPLLRKRCRPEDNIDRALDQLQSEHTLDGNVAEFIVSDLAVIAKGAVLANRIHLAINLCNFADSHRRHIAWENAIVLPLAHGRLTEADLIGLGQAMAGRRGLKFPERAGKK
jgi:hemerythrin-like domain-containing protein